MKIIVDTSIWIEYFRGNNTYLSLFNLATKQQVFVTELIEAELLQGAKSQREINYIEEYFFSLQKIPLQNLLKEAAKTSSKMKWSSQGLSLVDSTIIYAAWQHNLQIWTLDKNLIKAAGTNFIVK